VTTSATGFFEFTNLDPGTYELAASAAGFTPRVISRLATDAETWASFGLSRSVSTGTAILQGVVYTGGDSSNRIPFAEIQLSTGHSATADANGFYKITDLPDGEVRITASKDGASASVDRNLVGGETVWGSVQL
jgi:hypothetical protein